MGKAYHANPPPSCGAVRTFYAVTMIELAHELQALALRVDKHAGLTIPSDAELLAIGQDIRRAKYRLEAWAGAQDQS